MSAEDGALSEGAASAGEPAGAELPSGAIDRPFGADSRAQLLADFFKERSVVPDDAWEDVYRLLLWTDRTTGLAHCYESDKAQPGRPWYERTLRFHAWVSDALGVEPADLEGEIDWLFRQAMVRLSGVIENQRLVRDATIERQRELFKDRDMPRPGLSSELRSIFERLAATISDRALSDDAMQQAAEEISAYFAAENKRKNLLGEGFEDVLAAVMRRLPGQAPSVEARRILHDLPGFREPATGEKPRRVDLGIVTRAGRRVLVSVKWSVRADREEQFGVDYENYARLEASGESFDFVLVTNEFDAARLRSACRRRVGVHPLFAQVVHVNPEAVLVTYGGSARGAAAELPGLVAAKRIISLAEWLADLNR